MPPVPTNQPGRFRAVGLLVALLAPVAALTLSGLPGAESAPLPTYVGTDDRAPATSSVRSLALVRADVPVTDRQSSRGRQPPRTAPLPKVAVVDATRPPRRLRQTGQPTRLVVARLDLDVEVVPVGVTGNGSMELPATVRRAGWYRFGATPEQRAGTTVIAAHVDTMTEGLGPFARLASARPGDRVQVMDGRGRRVAFEVTVRRLVTRSRLPVDELFTRGGPARLVLITCGGTYSARDGYADNLVIIAEPRR